MFDSFKSYKLFEEAVIFRSFLFVFTLRQGAILIAVHQLALSALLLIILLTGLSHVDTMMSMLQTDMADDADTREYYRKILHGEESLFPNGEPIHSLNDKMFSSAKHLASETVILLYSSTILTAIYLLTCISLLYGTIKYKRQYIFPWIVASLVVLMISTIVLWIGGEYYGIVKIFGGPGVYYICATVVVGMLMYVIHTVTSFFVQIELFMPDVCSANPKRENVKPKPRHRQQKYELGERMVLIDHAAQSSVVSTSQLNKLSQGMQSHFV